MVFGFNPSELIKPTSLASTFISPELQRAGSAREARQRKTRVIMWPGEVKRSAAKIASSASCSGDQLVSTAKANGNEADQLGD